MQTILGAGGVIGRELARALRAFTDQIRLVSRSPRPVHPTDETHAADLLDAAATDRAVAGSDVAYLVVGLKYDTEVWREQWPRIMRNVIDACKRRGARLGGIEVRDGSVARAGAAHHAERQRRV